MRPRIGSLLLLIGLGLLPTGNAPADILVIAHRGASAYLPEHTIEAYVLAHGQGADFLEPDLVMTADGHLIALHDLTLNATSDVAKVFPNRAREDGGFYALDFTLAEIRQLNARERLDTESDQARFPQRWSPDQGRFRIVTLGELIEVTRELNRTTGRRVGLYPEMKFPKFHADNGHDIAKTLVTVLERYGLPEKNLPVFIQSFEPEPLIRIRAAHGGRFELIQLIGSNDWNMNTVDYETMMTAEGLAEVAEFAHGIGPHMSFLIDGDFAAGQPHPSRLYRHARSLGLALHPYTFRREGLPDGLTLEALLDFFLGNLAVEGIFTDNPDVAVERRLHLRSHAP
jgi:glycerophosphoryl diester phosphodiesterase